MFERTVAVIGLLAMLSLPAALRAQNLVSNGSFEVAAAGTLPNATLDPGATNLTGWTVIGGGNLLWCDSSSFCNRPAFDGTFSLDLTGLVNQAPYAGVQQAVATTVGRQYSLGFALTGRSDSVPVSVKASAGGATSIFQTATADWVQHRLDFTALSSSTIVSIVGESAGGSGLALQLDAVSVVASAVPEPATAATLLAGLAAVLAARLRPAGPAGSAAPLPAQRLLPGAQPRVGRLGIGA